MLVGYCPESFPFIYLWRKFSFIEKQFRILFSRLHACPLTHSFIHLCVVWRPTKTMRKTCRISSIITDRQKRNEWIRNLSIVIDASAVCLPACLLLCPRNIVFTVIINIIVSKERMKNVSMGKKWENLFQLPSFYLHIICIIRTCLWDIRMSYFATHRDDINRKQNLGHLLSPP